MIHLSRLHKQNITIQLWFVNGQAADFVFEHAQYRLSGLAADEEFRRLANPTSHPQKRDEKAYNQYINHG
jgi:hypothetical protein